MKALNHFLGLFFIAILIGMTSCAKQDLEINENRLAPSKKAASTATTLDVAPILLDNDAYNLSGDLFTAMDFTIEDEIIMLSVNYLAGCNPVQFRLVADPQVQYGAGNVPFFNGKLILDNDDKCSYTVKKTVAYDLSELQQVGYGKVILKIDGFGEALYSY
jgi:hypothetical protein